MKNIKAVSVLIIVEIIALIAVMVIIMVRQFFPNTDTGVPEYVPKEVTSELKTSQGGFERPADLMEEETKSLLPESIAKEDIPEHLRGRFSEPVILRLMSMTPEQKAAQLFITDPSGLLGEEMGTAVEGTMDDLGKALLRLPVAGIVFPVSYFAPDADIKSELQTLSEYSKEASGMVPFLMPEESELSMKSLGEMGFNLYGIPMGEEYEGGLMDEAAKEGLLPVFTGEAAELALDPVYYSSVSVAHAESAQEIADNVNGGMRFIYRTDNISRTCKNLTDLLEEGELSSEELDIAAGNIIALKEVLEDMVK